MDIKEVYENKKQDFTAKSNASKRRLRQLSLFRLLSFLSIAAGVYFFINELSTWATICFFPGVLAFLCLVVFYENEKNRMRFYIELKKIQEEELKVLDGDFRFFDDGKAFNHPDHPYSNDMDVFGPASVFQYLNRTGTAAGASFLANILSSSEVNPDRILERQALCKELADDLEWTQEYQASARLCAASIEDKQQLAHWLKQENSYYGKPIYKVLLLLMPLIGLSLLTLTIAGVISDWVWVNMFLIGQLSFVGMHLKKNNHTHFLLSKRHELLKEYARLLQMIESKRFSSALGKQYQEQITKDGELASTQLKKLSNIVQWFDNRLNIIIAIGANALFLFDIQCVYKLEKWKQSYGAIVASYFHSIAAIDANIGLSRMAINEPDFCFPTPGNHYQAKALGHPLLNASSRICNDINVETGQFVIITGSNMSGKSTFLRTIGVNLILAQCGAPVCASSFTFSPAALFSGMRANDSLDENASYFYAELKRLRFIVEALEKKEPMLVLLDEILRGTNSLDKQKGSLAFVRKLVQLGATGMMATHDLVLGTLAEETPEKVINHCFEVETTAEGLVFDYKLRNGVCENLNAVYLMKAMGIM